MIRPEEIVTKISVDIYALIEAQFDEAIRKSADANVWPAVVPLVRDGASLEDVDKVIAVYRDAGWDVWTGPRYRAAISKPVAP